MYVSLDNAPIINRQLNTHEHQGAKSNPDLLYASDEISQDRAAEDMEPSSEIVRRKVTHEATTHLADAWKLGLSGWKR
ncbi:uncharacterized protein N7525_007537 [Penicillium rubens]|jgi:hypothetical protein|uniref:uncharacterized protein n=1 Tax=Penicillium rubens TaxID=1108849 RepID=UPI002A5A5E74|nr:uncharacterized protein N7525_007537 [Penicillium rubens]KAJ5829284.1 hypothetical protein N7525_007537 [Penicillium rubens]KAJ5841156.1 hypothetical protein N7534_010986 [Penicillium rubens]